MTPTLRTAILDALMERWEYADVVPAAKPLAQDYLSSCLDMILPVAEPMIREAALREAAGVAQAVAAAAVIVAHRDNYHARGKADAAKAIALDILALGEPK